MIDAKAINDVLSSLIQPDQQHSQESVAMDAEDVSQVRIKAIENEEYFNLDPVDLFRVVSSNKQPCYDYDVQKQAFIQYNLGMIFILIVYSIPSQNLSFGQVESRVDFFRKRYDIIKQWLRRNEMYQFQDDSSNQFSDGTLGSLGITSTKKVLSITSLRGRPGVPVVLLGGLFQIEDVGIWHLEDPTGSIELDISGCIQELGWYSEGCIVLAKGKLCEDDGKFHVNVISHPPKESAIKTKYYSCCVLNLCF